LHCRLAGLQAGRLAGLQAGRLAALQPYQPFLNVPQVPHVPHAPNSNSTDELINQQSNKWINWETQQAHIVHTNYTKM
jgi:hypothetical protein